MKFHVKFEEIIKVHFEFDQEALQGIMCLVSTIRGKKLSVNNELGFVNGRIPKPYLDHVEMWSPISKSHGKDLVTTWILNVLLLTLLNQCYILLRHKKC
uniref:Uncharacterized protein n=1 Tax=Lactuca sativa TaxID=4236 RepID=A0A9R1UTR4_LACSA|nr:hypothetical protein LSAT_V11C800413120 [Lactuca sativa]